MDAEKPGRTSILRVQDLSLQLDEGQAVLSALRAGEVDALVVSHPDGDRVYTLQSEDRIYRVLVERMGMGAALLSRDGSILFCNRHFARMLGRSSQDLVSLSLKDFVTPEDRAYLARALGGDGNIAATTCEGNLIQQDGTTIPVEIAISPLNDVTNDALSAVITDLSEHRRVEQWLEERVRERTAELEATNARLQSEIDERRRVENALRESEDRFRTLANNIAQFAWMADENGSLFWYNRRWYEYTGATPEEMERWGWRKVYHPDYVDAVTEKFRRHVESGQEWEDTFPLRGRDGTYRWFLSRALPIRDETGKILRWFGTNTDVTELRRLQEELRTFNETLERRVEERTSQLQCSERDLRESQEQLQYVLEASGMGAWSLNLSTQALWRSPHHDRLFGYDQPLPEWTHEIFLEHVVPEDRELVQDSIREARELRRKQWSVECRIKRRDGVVRVLRIQSHLRRIEAGQSMILLGLTQDVTEEKRVQEALRQSERLAAMGEAMAVIGHESRNALQRSQTCLDMMARRVAGNDEVLRLIEMARSAQQDVQRVHEEIREFSAPLVLRRSLQRIDSIWREAWDEVADLRKGRSAELIESICTPDCTAEVDPFRLKQVFRNIMENSLHACGNPTVIRIECSCEDVEGNDAIRIAVRDNGPGIPSELKTRAFEPFFTTKTKGTGLGMTITRRVVESHGGQVYFGDLNEPGLEVVLVLPRRSE